MTVRLKTAIRTRNRRGAATEASEEFYFGLNRLNRPSGHLAMTFPRGERYGFTLFYWRDTVGQALSIRRQH
jgi:hypothetical protein